MEHVKKHTMIREGNVWEYFIITYQDVKHKWGTDERWMLY
jgi:hypothetical protein